MYITALACLVLPFATWAVETVGKYRRPIHKTADVSLAGGRWSCGLMVRLACADQGNVTSFPYHRFPTNCQFTCVHFPCSQLRGLTFVCQQIQPRGQRGRASYNFYFQRNARLRCTFFEALGWVETDRQRCSTCVQNFVRIVISSRRTRGTIQDNSFTHVTEASLLPPSNACASYSRTKKVFASTQSQERLNYAGKFILILRSWFPVLLRSVNAWLISSSLISFVTSTSRLGLFLSM